MSSDRATALGWELFVAGEETVPGVRPEVLRSWQRCRDTYHVDPARTHAPLAPDAPPVGLEEHMLAAELGAAAASIGADAARVDAAVAACDGEGTVLACWGDRDVVDRTRVQNFGPAFAWSESSAGTSGIGTALATRGVVEIRKFEHWCSGFHSYSCSAIAVCDPTTTEPVGTIALIVCDQPIPAEASKLLKFAASALESRLRANSARTSAELAVAFNAARARARAGSVALDVAGRVVAADSGGQAALSASEDAIRKLARAVVSRSRLERGWIGAAEIDPGNQIKLEPVYSSQHQVIGVLVAVEDAGLWRSAETRLEQNQLAGMLDDRVILVSDEEVRFVEIVGGALWIDTDRGRLRASGRTLDELEKRLVGRRFLRVNRRTLVNLTRVRELRPGFRGGQWVLVDGSSVPIDVARRRLPDLRDALGLSI